MKNSHRANVTMLNSETITLNERAKAELTALEGRPIDLTDPDAPEVTDWSTAQRGKFYRPVSAINRGKGAVPPANKLS